MSEEILVNVTPQETRIALVENGVLQEVYVERLRNRGIVGNIYKGRVNRVLPGMDAAFVDIGLERGAFLHVSDIDRHMLPAEWDTGQAGDPVAPAVMDGANGNGRPVGIVDLLRQDQDVLVQVIKDPLGTKGARLTSQITVPSRYLVYMPHSHDIGVSARIEDPDERARLKGLTESLRERLGDGGGFILRTAAEGASAEELERDMAFLLKLWQGIQERTAKTPPGNRVHEDLPIVLRTLRDMVGENVEKIRIDSRETYHRAVNFAEQLIPDILPLIEHYPGERPIFDLYGVEDEMQRALERKVELKSGGYLILDQTEAMTTVDVNTGGFVGHRNLEETIFKTNLEAAQAIARQLRLRNLGGIIIIDFIDMAEDEHKRQVLRALEKSLERDHAKTNVCEVSRLGLVEMTRKRTRESLEHVLCEECPVCKGRGSIKSPETVCFEIFREILRESRQFDARRLMVLAAPRVIDRLLDEESTGLAELQDFTGVPVKLQVEELYSPEQYDVVLV